MEQYKSTLEDELQRLEKENMIHQAELARIGSSVKDYVVLAPVAGILMQCRGITRGSVLPAGILIGSISPAGDLVAECYVVPREISSIRTGMKVQLAFEKRGYRNGYRTETKVSQIDPDVLVVSGRPVYRIRCLLEEAEPVITGMTFSASMVLDRRSLAALLVEKLDRWGNPALARHKGVPDHGKGS